MKLLFWGSLILGLYFIYSFFKGQKTLKPSKLNLKAGERAKSANDSKAEFSLGSSESEFDSFSVPLRETIRSLNVIFIYNGHSFDAFEVLGVQAGASLEQVKKAFEKTLAKTDPSSKEFIECALRAVLEDHKRSRR